MSTIEEVNAEQLAKLFYNYREALAQDCTKQHSNENQKPESSWERTPQSERKLMVAAARLTLLELLTTPADTTPGRKYYAKPGEANWGC
jgi:hypothetical protein